MQNQNERCQSCEKHQAMHFTNKGKIDEWLCCECWVKNGNIPSNWHTLCMEIKTKLQKAGKMKVNLDGLLQNAAKATRGIYGHSLLELLENLKVLRQRTKDGDMTALDDFFSIYVVKENDDERSVLSNNRPVV